MPYREQRMKLKYTLVGAFGLIGLLVVCVAAIVIAGKDVAAYLAFTSPIVTVLLSLLVISKQVDDIRIDAADTKEVVKTIEHQTNGKLEAQFADLKTDLKDHIDNVVNPDD